MIRESDNTREEYGDVISSFDFFLEQQFNNRSTIIEIGCNIGSFLNLIYAKGYSNIYGIDNSKNAIHYGRQKYPKLKNCLMVADGSWIPFKSNSIDIIVSFDTLEHIPNVNKHISEVGRVLKNNNGIYVLQTPNKYINIPWEIIHSRDMVHYNKKAHCSLQTYSSLISLLSKNGFQEINIVKRNVLTEYNNEKVRKALGNQGILLLKILNSMPKKFFPNFWVVSKKNEKGG